jgi:glycosyltransferase involved in cell wall biosynthesis
VKVFNETSQLNRDNKLIIQGHFGNQYEEIISLGSLENIEIREANPNVEIFFSSINTLVLPSLFEGCPNVLFEALLRKKLCIVSEGANTDGFIVDGMNGYVYDGSDKGLEAAMKNAVMISGHSKEKLIIENGYNYAKENFSMKVMVSKYEELFKTIYENN